MNVMSKRLLALIICGAIFICMLSGCSSGDDNNSDPPTSGGATETPEIIGEESDDSNADVVTDNVPEYNFDGAEFKIASVDNPNFSNIYVLHEESGEILDDAIYRRTLYIEERFNVKITEFFIGDGEIQSRFSREVKSGMSSFHMANLRCDHALALWIGGNTVPWNEIPNIDLTKEYWAQSINNSLTINNYQPMSIGSFNIGTYDLCYVLLFNKQLIGNLGLASPYALVESGEWTFDAMNDMMKAFTADINGDSVMDKSDNYGYVANSKMVVPNFYISAGEMSIKKDKDDIPYFAVGGDRFMTVWEKVYTMMYDNRNWYKDTAADYDVPTSSVTAFQENRALFMDTSLFEIERLRSMETDFGIIPYPKYDLEQDRYYSRLSYYIPTVVPVTNQELEMTGAIFEALNAESHRTVLPTYIETMLKVRNSRDEESEKMIDLIFNTLVVDIGDTTLCSYVRDNFIASMFHNDNRNFASTVEKQAPRIDKELAKMIISD